MASLHNICTSAQRVNQLRLNGMQLTSNAEKDHLCDVILTRLFIRIESSGKSNQALRYKRTETFQGYSESRCFLKSFVTCLQRTLTYCMLYVLFLASLISNAV